MDYSDGMQLEVVRSAMEAEASMTYSFNNIPGESCPPRVSVILPVFSVEPYIGKCIESLQAQRMDELEFIFVDDCGTDGSMEAVEAWAARDNRVSILRNECNIGAGSSRNRGIAAAIGDYLSFIDPDDYVSPNYYAALYAAAMAGGGHDIAKGRRLKVDESGEAAGDQGQDLNERIRAELERGKPLFRSFTYENQSAIYRRVLLEDGCARYGSSRNAEDTTFLLRCCRQTDDIVLEEAAIYFYVQRKGSVVHGNYLERTNGEIDALHEKVDFLIKEGIDTAALQYLLAKHRPALRDSRSPSTRDSCRRTATFLSPSASQRSSRVSLVRWRPVKEDRSCRSSSTAAQPRPLVCALWESELYRYRGRCHLLLRHASC